jgi:hypothetical protein
MPGYKKASPAITALNAILPEEIYCFLQLTSVLPMMMTARPRLPQFARGGEDENELPWEATNDNAPHGQTVPIDFDLDKIPLVDDEDIREEDTIHSNNLSARLLHWHYYCLQHLPFMKLQAMAAEQGRLSPPVLLPS